MVHLSCKGRKYQVDLLKSARRNAMFRMVLGELFSEVERWHRNIQYENDWNNYEPGITEPGITTL